ncbi:MAG: sugar nucleotide-binding protein [Nanoarchaeota archaeon]
MKGIVFGKGFLGTRISNEFNYTLSNIRITEENSLKNYLRREKPDVVINSVGKTGRPNIDWCEINKEDVISSNILAPVMLSNVCSKENIYLVHIGSGCIYFGNKGGEGFDEKDEPNFYGPQFYAKTKILSEKILSEFNHLQLRIRMPIDDRSHERNLIDKIKKYNKLIDVQNSMTTIPHMLNALEILIERRKRGIYNLVNPGTISPVEIMRMYQKIINPSHQFEKMELEELNKITPGIRSNCYLNTNKLKSEGIILPEIHEAVEECLLKYKENLK